MVTAPSRCFVVAEAGVNHNGDPALAHRLIDAAAAAGADAVKFQTFRADRLASASAGRAAYQERAVGSGSQVEMLRALELSDGLHAELAAHCREAAIEFMSTPFHAEAADLLAPLVSRFKIGSGDLTDLPFLDHVARIGKPMILSTGMSVPDEIRAAVETVRARAIEPVLLHCTSLYPAPAASVNLRAMATLRESFRTAVGYSDHTEGLAVGLAAVALGAAVLEKHFTLDRGLPGPDHRASLEPRELKLLVESARSVEAALGDGVKRLMPGEDAVRLVARKSLTTTRALAAGVPLDAAMLCAKRPGTGIPPGELPKVLGRRLRRGLEADRTLAWEDLQ